MAKDGTVQPRKGTEQIDQDEEFFNSPMGQDITKLFEEFTSGKKTFEQAEQEFNAKWGKELASPAQPSPPKQVPNTPYLPVR